MRVQGEIFAPDSVIPVLPGSMNGLADRVLYGTSILATAEPGNGRV